MWWFALDVILVKVACGEIVSDRMRILGASVAAI